MKTEVFLACLLALATKSHAISFRLEPEFRKCIREEVHKDVLVVGEYRLSEVEGQQTDLVVRVGKASRDVVKGHFHISSDMHFCNALIAITNAVCRLPIPKAIPCSVKRQHLKEGLPSPLKSTTCLKSAFTQLYQVGHRWGSIGRGQDESVLVMCVGPGGEVERDVHLELKHGVEAKNYDDVSNTECVCTWELMQLASVQLGKAEKLKPMELELRRLEDLAESIVNDFAYMRAREEEMRDTNGEN